jgi:transcriptional regulator GlxA family with amidase domain
VQHMARGRSGWDASALLHLVDVYLDYCAVTRTAARVTELASRLGIDRSHLIRIFRSQLHVPPREVLHDLQVRRAKELLNDPSNTNDDIASAAGFGTRGTFQRVFALRTGMSPEEYRRLYAAK